MASLNELREGAQEWDRFYRETALKQLSRRRVLKGSTALALLSAGGIGALLGACGDDSGATPAGTAAGGAAATATKVAVESITGDWDTTGTPPYKGLPDSATGVDPAWKQYAWIYKYGPWRYNWNVPVTRGGEIRQAGGPPANYNVMVNGITSQPFYNKLFNQDIREGIVQPKELYTKAFNNELAISSEHTPDYTGWTFKVPTNAFFHNLPPVNGRALTAKDVAYSFQRHLEANVNRTILARVKSVTAVDDVTVRFDLKEPQVRFTTSLSSPHLPVFAQEAYENQDRFTKQPIGTGPYVLTFSEFQNRATWERHPKYWQVPPFKPEKYGKDPLPLTDKVTKLAFANVVASREAFYNRDVDEMGGNSTDPAVIKDALSRVPDAVLNSNGYWTCCPLGMLLQYKNPLFQDIRIRQALSMSIDRGKVWSDGMQKTGVIIASPLPLDDMGSNFPPPLKDYGPNAQFDVARAKQLLKEAGHDQPLKLKIFTTPDTGSPFYWPLNTVVFQWKQAGIVDAEIVTRDATVFLNDQLNKSFPDMLYPQSTTLPFGFTLDSLVEPALRTGSGSNFGSLSDTTLDGLFDQWNSATDPAKGVELAKKMATRIVENVDHVWFANHGGVDVTQPWIHGMVFTPYAAINYIGLSSTRYQWIDQTAPGGRGGKPVA